MTEVLLYTLAPSHFCERARWALDRNGPAYEERRLALGPHVVRLRAMGLQDTALPVLRLADGTLVQGSGRILDHCGFPLRDAGFDERFERSVGTLVRRFVYAAAFASPDDGGVGEVLLDGVEGAERLAGLASWPLLRPRLAAALRVAPEALPEIAAALDAELAWCDALVGEGVLGQDCDRAAITAASLLSPLARPPEGPVRRRLALSPGPAAILRGWAERPALAWVREAYRRHRRSVGRDAGGGEASS